MPENFWPTIGFWIVFWIIVPWVLKRFYFKHSPKKAERLRYAALVLNSLVLGLIFFQWIPASHGGQTGLELFLQGRWDMILFSALLALSIALLFTKKHALLKTAAVFQIFNSAFFIFLMIRLMPQAYYIKLSHVAPIIISLLLLTTNVVVVLLWHQLEIQEKGYRAVVKDNFLNRHWSKALNIKKKR
ncbi:hypothetical protein KJ969_04990 [Patescibacteria group bacterium]|nr:hypothetical protein [Patescibacteria group bacterium]MBU1922046.1 hypothetical protein [Patescibacteria group bacterium]